MAYSDTTWQNGTTPINEINLNNIESGIETIDKNVGTNTQSVYDNTQTYAVGSIVVYNNLLYKCTTAVTTAEDFDSTKWTRINILNNIIKIIEKEIPANTDFDTLTVEGIYYIFSAAPSGNNAPINSIGILKVEKMGSIIRQNYETWNGLYIFKRAKMTANWESWRKYSNDNNIIESGSNANGYYTKFPDGTLIQQGYLSLQANESNKDLTFPTPFYDTNYHITMTNGFNYSGEVIWNISGRTVNKIGVYPRIKSAVPTVLVGADWIAVGRWK